jgi:hypothetical protein
VQFPNEDPDLPQRVLGLRREPLRHGLYKRPKVGAFTFQHPGVVKVYCNIHPQMSAVVVVRDNPLFTKAGRRTEPSRSRTSPPGKYVGEGLARAGGRRGVRR